jgi:hypothetical protein
LWKQYDLTETISSQWFSPGPSKDKHLAVKRFSPRWLADLAGMDCLLAEKRQPARRCKSPRFGCDRSFQAGGEGLELKV